ncbi:MAG: 2-succinyl-5-enolpyruvyl-6-hydroxy-3-cyclohexene-1-carboxylate synthase, partial [Halobacteriales archaeon]|nr:2-succinyl-5-enolpyruvyl-6-hydroxy-3-cyclohexene-1-carboxylate synthase [Halobacteriales archaeon]
EPGPGEAMPARAERPFVGATRAAPRPLLPEARQALRAALALGRGIIVLGPQDDLELAQLAAELSVSTGFPLLADPLSQARFGLVADVALGSYDAALAAHDRPAPQLALRFGAAPTSDALSSWLERHDVPQLCFDDAPWREPALLHGARLPCDAKLAARALLEDANATAEPAWTQGWRSAERAVHAAHAASLRAWFEGSALSAVVDALPERSTLFVGNSLPIRDLDRFVKPAPKPLRLLGNRGASGIDGVTSTALGVRAGSEEPLCLVTGDVSFAHDLPGLVALKRHAIPACVVVLHNDGGRIFEQLPAAQAWSPQVRDLFVTPHGLDFAHAARMFGAGFARVEDTKALRDEVLRATEAGRAHIIEARIDPAVAQQARAEAARAVEAALRVH